jgi:hypothetical protein
MVRSFCSLRKPSADDTVFLIVDGHYSYTKYLGQVDKAREHSVAIVSLHPHSTHIMQPLDIGIVKPLTTYCAQEIETWLGSNPGRVVTPFIVWKLFRPAYRIAATMETSLNPFIKTGLFPSKQIHTRIPRTWICMPWNGRISKHIY